MNHSFCTFVWDMPIIEGNKITLRPATITDRKQIYEWLAQSDITSKMLGLPDFPDNPIPTWEEFVEDYSPQFFTDLYPENGRSFIIEVDDEPIGHINYNEIDPVYQSVELDIWLAGSQYCNKGYGTDAIDTLCNYITNNLDCNTFIIAPSARNTVAIHAYEKCGFKRTHVIPAYFIPDYDDTVVLMKKAGE